MRSSSKASASAPSKANSKKESKKETRVKKASQLYFSKRFNKFTQLNLFYKAPSPGNLSRSASKMSTIREGLKKTVSKNPIAYGNLVIYTSNPNHLTRIIINFQINFKKLGNGLKKSPSSTKVAPSDVTPSISIDNLAETVPMIEPNSNDFQSFNNYGQQPIAYNQNNNYEYDQNYYNNFDQVNANINYDMSNQQNMNNQFYQSNQYTHESQNSKFDQLFHQTGNGQAQFGQNDTYYNSTDGQYYNNNSYDYNNPSSYNYQNSQYNGSNMNQGYQAVSRSPSPVLNFRPAQNMQHSSSNMPSGTSQHSIKGAFFNYNVIRNNKPKSNNEDWI